MRVTVNKKTGKITYHYNTSLEKEIESCRREIEKKTGELAMYRLIKDKFDHEYNSRVDRIKYCKDFIELATEELSKNK